MRWGGRRCSASRKIKEQYLLSEEEKAIIVKHNRVKLSRQWSARPRLMSTMSQRLQDSPFRETEWDQRLGELSHWHFTQLAALPSHCTWTYVQQLFFSLWIRHADPEVREGLGNPLPNVIVSPVPRGLLHELVYILEVLWVDLISFSEV